MLMFSTDTWEFSYVPIYCQNDGTLLSGQYPLMKTWKSIWCFVTMNTDVQQSPGIIH